MTISFIDENSVIRTDLLLRAGRSLWSAAAAGLPPGPRTPPSILPKSRRTDAEGDVPSPRTVQTVEERDTENIRQEERWERTQRR